MRCYDSLGALPLAEKAWMHWKFSGLTIARFVEFRMAAQDAPRGS